MKGFDRQAGDIGDKNKQQQKQVKNHQTKKKNHLFFVTHFKIHSQH